MRPGAAMPDARVRTHIGMQHVRIARIAPEGREPFTHQQRHELVSLRVAHATHADVDGIAVYVTAKPSTFNLDIVSAGPLSGEDMKRQSILFPNAVQRSHHCFQIVQFPISAAGKLLGPEVLCRPARDLMREPVVEILASAC